MRTNRLACGPEISEIGFGAWKAGRDQWRPSESSEAVVGAKRTALDIGDVVPDDATREDLAALLNSRPPPEDR